MKAFLFYLILFTLVSFIPYVVLRSDSKKSSYFFQESTPEKNVHIDMTPIGNYYVNLQVSDPRFKLKSVTIYAIIGKPIMKLDNINLSMVKLPTEQLKPGKYLIKYTLSNNINQVMQLIRE
ncbi:T9SS sorting signal type C domain-containing protein [Elizabethkingia meningoseptica]|uniref:T9SS sorting signal type C domain-containing protein n=1 Tax=Elizabethkingia meningoseptica TaxID=238 RepID=UPI0030181458